MWAYEAERIFRDRLVGDKDIAKFDSVLTSILRSQGLTLDKDEPVFYVTWGTSHAAVSSSPKLASPDSVVGHFGRQLGQLSFADMQEEVAKATVAYGK